LFVEQAALDVTAIVTSVEQKNAAALSAAAHRLKGASANVAAETMRRIASELEGLGSRGDVTAARALLQPLEAELIRLKNLPAFSVHPKTPSTS
jgi:HPt (histidine-containing phosphotransfer) domain-containing protein